MHLLKTYSTVLLFLILPISLFAQDDLLNELESQIPEERQKVSSVFKGIKIINLESTKLIGKNQLYFVIAHRFGSIKNGIDSFFGLDDASVRIQFIYAPTTWLNIGASRSGFNKTYDLSLKYKLASQEKGGMPVSIVGYHLINVNTNIDKNLFPLVQFKDRLGYANQLLISRKFNNWLSLQLAPTYFYDNTVVEEGQSNAQFALGMGGRFKLTKRFALLADYGWHLNRVDNSVFNNSLSLGIEVETGGHVFQLHFSNSQAIFENGFLGQARGDWGDGDIFFGFNISRAFSLKKKK